MIEPEDPIIWRSYLQTEMNRCSETIRRWMLDGTLPKPDINASRKTIGWRHSTLVAAGIYVRPPQ